MKGFVRFNLSMRNNVSSGNQVLPPDDLFYVFAALLVSLGKIM